MKLILTIVLCFICLILNAQDKYYIFQCEKVKLKNSINHILLNKKRYKSLVEKNVHGRHEIDIKTDSISIKLYVLKRSYTHRGVHEILVAKHNRTFYIKEFYFDDFYYLMIIPIKLSNFNKHIDGSGDMLIISTNKEVWNFLKDNDHISTTVN